MDNIRTLSYNTSLVKFIFIVFLGNPFLSWWEFPEVPMDKIQLIMEFLKPSQWVQGEPVVEFLAAGEYNET